MGIPHPEQHAYKHHDEKCNLEEKKIFLKKLNFSMFAILFEKLRLFHTRFKFQKKHRKSKFWYFVLIAVVGHRGPKCTYFLSESDFWPLPTKANKTKLQSYSNPQNKTQSGSAWLSCQKHMFFVIKRKKS